MTRIDPDPPRSAAELPFGWVEQHDAASGRPYYHHLATDKILYTRPSKPLPAEAVTTSHTYSQGISEYSGSANVRNSATSGQPRRRSFLRRNDAPASGIPSIFSTLATNDRGSVGSSASTNSNSDPLPSPPPPYTSPRSPSTQTGYLSNSTRIGSQSVGNFTSFPLVPPIMPAETETEDVAVDNDTGRSRSHSRDMQTQTSPLMSVSPSSASLPPLPPLQTKPRAAGDNSLGLSHFTDNRLSLPPLASLHPSSGLRESSSPHLSLGTSLSSSSQFLSTRRASMDIPPSTARSTGIVPQRSSSDPISTARPASPHSVVAQGTSMRSNSLRRLSSATQSSAHSISSGATTYVSRPRTFAAPIPRASSSILTDSILGGPSASVKMESTKSPTRLDRSFDNHMAPGILSQSLSIDDGALSQVLDGPTEGDQTTGVRSIRNQTPWVSPSTSMLGSPSATTFRPSSRPPSEDLYASPRSDDMSLPATGRYNDRMPSHSGARELLPQGRANHNGLLSESPPIRVENRDRHTHNIGPPDINRNTFDQALRSTPYNISGNMINQRHSVGGPALEDTLADMSLNDNDTSAPSVRPSERRNPETTRNLRNGTSLDASAPVSTSANSHVEAEIFADDLSRGLAHNAFRSQKLMNSLSRVRLQKANEKIKELQEKLAELGRRDAMLERELEHELQDAQDWELAKLDDGIMKDLGQLSESEYNRLKRELEREMTIDDLRARLRSYESDYDSDPFLQDEDPFLASPPAYRPSSRSGLYSRLRDYSRDHDYDYRPIRSYSTVPPRKFSHHSVPHCLYPGVSLDMRRPGARMRRPTGHGSSSNPRFHPSSSAELGYASDMELDTDDKMFRMPALGDITYRPSSMSRKRSLMSRPFGSRGDLRRTTKRRGGRRVQFADEMDLKDDGESMFTVVPSM